MIKEKMLVLAVTVFTVFMPCHAQFRFLNTSSDFRVAFEKIMLDYCNHFANLKGEVVINNPQSSEYESIIKLPGAEECTIVEIQSKDHLTTAWQALILSTGEYETAAKKYKQLYSQLYNATVRIDKSGKQLTIKGEMDKPEAEKKIVSTLFSLTPETAISEKIAIELSMAYELMEWKIRISIYDKDEYDETAFENDN
ncbi:MAG TPA: hypothetical protein VFN30_02025 [Chitinophagaceae bacterium]|nr:hypothetical protein [Chitinophagaceae bacterium]